MHQPVLVGIFIYVAFFVGTIKNGEGFLIGHNERDPRSYEVPMVKRNPGKPDDSDFWPARGRRSKPIMPNYEWNPIPEYNMQYLDYVDPTALHEAKRDEVFYGNRGKKYGEYLLQVYGSNTMLMQLDQTLSNLEDKLNSVGKDRNKRKNLSAFMANSVREDVPLFINRGKKNNLKIAQKEVKTRGKNDPPENFFGNRGKKNKQANGEQKVIKEDISEFLCKNEIIGHKNDRSLGCYFKKALLGKLINGFSQRIDDDLKNQRDCGGMPGNCETSDNVLIYPYNNV